MLNKIIIMGRMTRDPELRKTQSGLSVASFTIAVDRDFSAGGEKQTDFINVQAWRNTADFVCKYFTKGSMAVVSGRLEIENYTDKNGEKRSAARVLAESVYFGESKGNSDAQPATAAAQPAAPTYTEYTDGDLPF